MEQVYITKSGKTYHYTDDHDCPTVSRIVRGKTQAEKVHESQAQQKGLALCGHCERERLEDTKLFYKPKKRKKRKPKITLKKILKLF